MDPQQISGSVLNPIDFMRLFHIFIDEPNCEKKIHVIVIYFY